MTTSAAVQQMLLAVGVSPSSETWSPTNKAAAVTLSNGNLTATGPASFGGYAVNSINANFYCEAVFTNFGSIPRFGPCTSSWSFTSQELGDSNSISYNPSSGQVRYAGGGIATIMTATTSDRICMAWEASTHKVWWRVNNGNWNNSGTDNPATSTGGYSNFNPGGAVLPAYEVFGSTASITAYFSQTSWLYTAPAGFTQIP